MQDATRLLNAIANGDAHASEQLFPLIYDELRRLAAQKLNCEPSGQTLDATALVHEAYLRLVGPDPGQPWNSRGHFFAAAAEAMRRILVDSVRRKKAAKRGGHRERVDLQGVETAAPRPTDDVLALDEALRQFEAVDPKKAELVKLRYFAGLTMEQIAEALGLSLATANRWWAFSRAWLHRHIVGSDS